jgi:hypothetical protein
MEPGPMAQATPSNSVTKRSFWLITRIVFSAFVLIAMALLFRLLVPALFGIIVAALLEPVRAVQAIHMIWTTQPPDMTGAHAFLFRVALTFVAGWHLLIGLVAVLFLVVIFSSR